MKKFDWKYYQSEMAELEAIKNNPASFKPIEINSELVKLVYTYDCAVADSKKPILTTRELYNCVGILAYDLSKGYAFLAHSYGNENYGIDNSFSPSQIYDGNFHRVPRGIIHGSSIHVVEMLSSLSKKELYQLKFVILIGSNPNLSLVSSMINTIMYLRKRELSIEPIKLMKPFIAIINTIMYLRKKRISIESIKLMKPFIEGIHTENDVNHGKDQDFYDLCRAYKNKEIVQNDITGETHSYDITRGASFAFDVRDGKMFTYNSDTNQYYTFDESPSVEIKIR